MAHRVGNLLLPAQASTFGPTRPNEPTVEILDPALAVLGSFFKSLIEHYCSGAWLAIAPNEPIVRTLIVGHDPEDWDFHSGMLPMLALWRESDGAAAPVRLQDGNTQQASAVNFLWVAPPADEQKLAARSPFFRAFSAALLLAYQNERDPCWIRRGDEASAPALTYGSYVWGHAGIDGWSYSGLRRGEFIVGAGNGNETYKAYESVWTIQESTTTDPSAFGSTINGVRVGTGSTSVHFNITDRDGDDPDALIRQSALVDPDDT